MISKGTPEGPLLIQITKLYHQGNYKNFDAFGRIISGTIKVNQSVKIMSDNY